MYAGIRQYRMDPALCYVVIRQTEKGLLPLLREEVPGFVAYYVLDAGDGRLVTVRICEDQAGLEKFDEVATEWIKRSLQEFISTVSDGAPGLLDRITGLLVGLEVDLRGPVYGEAKGLSSEEGSRPPEGRGLKELLSVEELCEELGMGKSWVYRRIRSGEIPHLRLGRAIKVERSRLAEYLEQQRYRPPGGRGER